MANKAPKKTPHVRRTNAERSALTRTKLIDAAIEILHQSGYSAATTIEVAKRARVSRGAMLHQFPTRADMLITVAHYIVERNTRYRSERLGDEVGLKRFHAAAEVSWELHSSPRAIALLEIMMASRNDRDLRKGLAPFVDTWMEVRRAAAARIAADLGVAMSASTEIETLITLRQAALRGLAIELMFLRNAEDIDKARRLLAEHERIFAERLMAAMRDS